MQIERALQPNHSENMRLVATFKNGKTARRVHAELLRHLDWIFTRGEKFNCAGFGRSFDSEQAFQVWKVKEWNPVADDRCKLDVERKDGRISVNGDYGLILDDWSKDDLGVALQDNVVALRTYTAGYGIDYLENWLSEKGGDVDVQVEGCEYDYLPLEAALEEVQAAAGKKRPRGLRAKDRNGGKAHPTGN